MATSTLVNEFGQPYLVPQKFAHAAERSRAMGTQFRVRSASLDELIPPQDRLTLCSLSERLYLNHGLVGAAIDQKAEYSVGDAFLPTYEGADEAAGDEVERWLEKVWFPNCDVRGGIHDWHQLLISVSIAIDNGDAFVMLSETNEGGFPLLQIIPSYRVRSSYRSYGAEDTVKEGQFAGARLIDGIIYNRRNRAIAYRVYSDAKNSDAFEDIPASAIIHLFNPRFASQRRGLPSFVRGLDDLKHCIQSVADERRRQAIISGLGLIVTNEMGGPDTSDPAVAMALGTDGSPVGATAYENRNGIYYLTANEGEKLEQIKHDSPGEIYESFHNRLNKMAIVGAGWASSLCGYSTGQGTAERGEILRARRAVTARQNLLRYLARRAVSYAYAYELERGSSNLPRLQSPGMWSFSKPPRLTVDDGREAKAMREDFLLGAINLADIHEANGTSEEMHLKKRIATLKRQKIAIYEANKELEQYGAVIEPREIVMLTANEMSQQTTPAQASTMDDSEDLNEDDNEDDSTDN